MHLLSPCFHPSAFGCFCFLFAQFSPFHILNKGSIKGLETCLYLLRRQNCSSEHFMYKHNIIHRVNYASVA